MNAKGSASTIPEYSIPCRIQEFNQYQGFIFGMIVPDRATQVAKDSLFCACTSSADTT
jgi:hypothetical protein